ncbi:hypothetical protein [Teredinibacter franksiae]|uniref:hypothetical protein n=1 Tax=Teredinibacter franksiae TaxID=2761453 RepID=UPI001623246F|nr:hypothetical protein [Teredinibacter franksiae]
MSLINEALKDLDARNTAAASGTPISPANNSTNLTRGIRIPVMFMVLLLAGFGLYTGYRFLLGEPGLGVNKAQQPLGSLGYNAGSALESVSVSSLSVNATERLVKANGKAKTGSVLVEAKTASDALPIKSQPNPQYDTAGDSSNLGEGHGQTLVLEALDKQELAEHQRVEPPQRGQGDSIEVLLQKIDSAIAAQRLTLPDKNSAWFYLAELRGIAPSSQVVDNRLSLIQQNYAQIIEASIAVNNLTKLQKLLARADQLGMQLPQNDDYQQQLIQLSERSGANAEVIDSVVTAEIQGGATSISIRRTLATVDKQTSERERERFIAGDRYLAIASLEKFLLETPAAEKSRLTLFDLYLQEGNTASASRLAATVQSNTRLQHYLQARVLVAEDNLAAARLLLEADATAMVKMGGSYSKQERQLVEQSSSLLAAIYQHFKEHELALGQYSYLLSLDRQKVDYWLGAAVSADALGMRADALTSFQQVLRARDLGASVEEYARKRVEALQVLAEQQKIAGSMNNR